MEHLPSRWWILVISLACTMSIHFYFVQIYTRWSPVHRITGASIVIKDCHCFNRNASNCSENATVTNKCTVNVIEKNSKTSKKRFTFCKEMFATRKSNSIFPDSIRIDNLIEKIQENYDVEFGGDSDAYEAISKYLPPLIEKYFRQDQGNNFSSVSSDHFDIVANMIKNQEAVTYKLVSETQTRLTLGNGILPHVPCTIKTDYSTNDITRCLNSTVVRNGGTFHVAFLGDSKLRDLFVALLIETRAMNYTIQQEVRIVRIS